MILSFYKGADTRQYFKYVLHVPFALILVHYHNSCLNMVETLLTGMLSHKTIYSIIKEALYYRQK